MEMVFQHGLIWSSFTQSALARDLDGTYHLDSLLERASGNQASFHPPRIVAIRAEMVDQKAIARCYVSAISMGDIKVFWPIIVGKLLISFTCE
jgi:hypothetical protein